MKKAMRRYVAPVLICAACGLRINGETRMVGGELHHPVCATKAKA